MLIIVQVQCCRLPTAGPLLSPRATGDAQRTRPWEAELCCESGLSGDRPRAGNDDERTATLVCSPKGVPISAVLQVGETKVRSNAGGRSMQSSPSGANRKGLAPSTVSDASKRLLGPSDKRHKSVVTSEPLGVRRITFVGCSSLVTFTILHGWPRQYASSPGCQLVRTPNCRK